MNIDKFIFDLEKKYPGELNYTRTIREFLESVDEIMEQNSAFEQNGIIERLTEPDRIIQFKVPWIDDEGKIRINKGYRIQFNNAIGPYKGGIRFHSGLTIDLLKSLAFEQTIKNSLTQLPMGGAKGGSDFDPKGKSESEIMRFCQAFMLELWKVIGPDLDIPAAELGVGTREIGYLYGMYLKLSGKHQSVITGRSTESGGNNIRGVATGYGIIYFLEQMLKENNDELEGKRIALSGYGNVARGAALKATECGAKVVTISGPDGYIYVPDGLTPDMIDYLPELKAMNDDMIRPFSFEFEEAQFRQQRKPWDIECDIAIPCAVEFDITEQDVLGLSKNKCKYIIEGANQACTQGAIDRLLESDIIFGPGKAANAGGVATSGLEIAQNTMHLTWSASEVDRRLKEIMEKIHRSCVDHGLESNGKTNYVKGANIAGFLRIANTMMDQGII